MSATATAAAILGGIDMGLTAIRAMSTGIAALKRQAAVLHQQGELSAEQLAAIQQRADAADAEVDNLVNAAKGRLGA
jgi:hypothetical protein